MQGSRINENKASLTEILKLNSC